MIDLRVKGLPNTVSVGGGSFFIKTDYREWLKFGVLMQQGCTYGDIAFMLEETEHVFTKEELKELVEQLQSFYANPNLTPNQIGGSNEKVIDYIEDGEYIYASFMQAYGIDLVEVDMHWHKFKALLASIPGDTKIASIMGYRSYSKSNKSVDSSYKDLKKAWAFPKEVDPELLEEINNTFYNC